METEKIKVGIVGLGFGAEFIPIYHAHPHAELVAICQRTKSKLNEIGDAFGVEKRYESYEDLLKDPDIDAIHINTPISLHGIQSIQALKAGKHVACTVPMATTVEECRQADNAIELIRHFPGTVLCTVQLPSGRHELEQRRLNLVANVNSVSKRAAIAGIKCSFHPNSPESLNKPNS